MTTEPQVRYFLGANSSHGFYSLYDQLIDPAHAKSIYILKGGAGCGKSSLMKRVAEQMEAAGLSVEYIYCSGDVNSLDAILIPEKKAAIIDGTAPHVFEPKYPGLVEHYVNLERCYDPKGLAPLRNEIIKCSNGYQSHYSRAYHCLSAAAEIEEDQRATLITPLLEEHIIKRTKGVLSRELKGKGKGAAPGTVKQRFLSGITHDGAVCFFDTADVLCKRVYELADSYGLAHIMLTYLLTAAVAAGHDVIACPSPMTPGRLEHLLIPGLSLAFLTSSPAMKYDKRPARRIRLDAMADGELLRRSKPRLRFSKKVSAALVEEAVSSFGQAKAVHDELEVLYNPHVDFGEVYRTADAITAQLLEL
jgi:hypothetical protein